MTFTLSGLPWAFQKNRAVLNADSFASAPPDAKNTPCMSSAASSTSRLASVMAGMLDEPTYPEK